MQLQASNILVVVKEGAHSVASLDDQKGNVSDKIVDEALVIKNLQAINQKIDETMMQKNDIERTEETKYKNEVTYKDNMEKEKVTDKEDKEDAEEKVYKQIEKDVEKDKENLIHEDNKGEMDKMVEKKQQLMKSEEEGEEEENYDIRRTVFMVKISVFWVFFDEPKKKTKSTTKCDKKRKRMALRKFR